MNRFVKVGVVLAGYVAAVLVSCAALAVRLHNTQGPDVDASAGMYAFGDAILFVEVACGAAIFPTGLCSSFLRPYRRFWTALSIAILPLAATGPLAAMVYAVAATRPQGSPWVSWAAFAVLRMLAASVLALPSQSSRASRRRERRDGRCSSRQGSRPP